MTKGCFAKEHDGVVTIEDQNGNVIWDSGAPTPAMIRAGASALAGELESVVPGVAEMLAERVWRAMEAAGR